MQIYILRQDGFVWKVWFNLDDAKEYMKLMSWSLVHESQPEGKLYMSDWSKEGLNEIEVCSIDAHEVIGFPTEAHVVGHTGGQD